MLSVSSVRWPPVVNRDKLLSVCLCVSVADFYLTGCCALSSGHWLQTAEHM